MLKTMRHNGKVVWNCLTEGLKPALYVLSRSDESQCHDQAEELWMVASGGRVPGSEAYMRTVPDEYEQGPMVNNIGIEMKEKAKTGDIN